jgi:hypothetical protein
MELMIFITQHQNKNNLINNIIIRLLQNLAKKAYGGQLLKNLVMLIYINFKINTLSKKLINSEI